MNTLYSHGVLIVSALLYFQQAYSFQSINIATKGRTSTTKLYATVLTPRQRQFWEDVEAGLDDVEKFYEEKGQSMERIRTFCARAQGDLPLPEPAALGHQPSEEHIDGLTANPYWDARTDTTNFPWAAELESKSQIIIDEFEQFEKEKETEESVFSGDSAWQSKVMGSGWSAFRLQRLGVWNTENCAKFPQTYALLKELNIPLAVRGVCFARQTPGSGVQPHTDGRNFILTSHLGLKIPNDCWIKVGEEQQTWTEGKLTTLDTSFEHSTGNPSNEDRHVLIIDFWHPELSEAERAGLEFIYNLRNEFESGRVPYREPRPRQTQEDEDEKEQEGQGIGGLLKSLFN